jgi:phosphate transport system substrate-binding protein
MLRFVMIALILCGGAVGGTRPKEDQVLQISCPEYLTALVKDLAKELQKQSPALQFEITTAGTDEGIDKLMSGSSDAVLISGPPAAEQSAPADCNELLPRYYPIAYDSIAIIVYPRNKAWNLTMDQLQKIYQKRIKSWTYCGWWDYPILPVCQNPKTGAHRLFTRLVMQEEDWLMIYRRYTERKESTVRGKVQVNRGAIGYVGPRYTGRYLKVLAVEGIEYTKENIRSGKYPLSEGIFFVTKGCPKPGAPLDALITFSVSQAGQQIIENKGFTPLEDL